MYELIHSDGEGSSTGFGPDPFPSIEDAQAAAEEHFGGPLWWKTPVFGVHPAPGGCGGSSYCPEGAVTRAQLAVFLERAVRGSDFMPPPATGATFSRSSTNSLNPSIAPEAKNHSGSMFAAVVRISASRSALGPGRED